tara:strand:- start:17 stop:763 length:747 start_codon:yes stop_codon:yes gene_type:complete
MQILALLTRDWLIVKKNILFYITLWIAMPIILHLILAIPLSQIIKMKVLYLNWSAASIWIGSSSIITYFESSYRMQKINHETDYISAILSTPIKNYQIIIANSIIGLILGIVQFLFSLIIISILHHEFYGLFNLIIIFFQIICLLIFVSIMGTLLGLLIPKRLLYLQISIIVLFIFCFGLGIFIPLSSYPSAYINVISFIPLIDIIKNIQSIITHYPISWFSYISNLMMAILFFLIAIIISKKNMRKL